MGILDDISTLEDLQLGPLEEGGWLANKRVFIRVDFNVPLDKKTGEITDDSRIREAVPSIRFAVEAGAKVIVASHLGRPDGKRVEKYSLEPCGARLAELTGYEVHLPEDCIGDAPKKVIHDLRVASPGSAQRGAPQVCLLENLRFHPGEEDNDESFVRALGELCDVYVNDAFGTMHRAHASVDGLPRSKKDRGAGFLVQRELEALGRLRTPERPYVAVLGGAKVSDKIDVIEALLEKCDSICIGGAMANTFLAAKGHDMQKSLVEEDKLALARTLIGKAESAGVALMLPEDVVVGESVNATSGREVAVSAVPAGMLALDIGQKTIASFARVLGEAKTIFWNGPMGVFETAPFDGGTMFIARALADATDHGVMTIIGGGDSAAAVDKAGFAKRMSHISTGGGASLEYLEGKPFAPLEVLDEA